MNRPQLDILGELLRSLRRAAGLTQEDAAARSGLSSRAIREIEGGRGTRPRRKTVELLGRALELNPAQLAELLAAAGHPPVSGRAAPRRPAPMSRTSEPPAGNPAPQPGRCELITDVAAYVGRAAALAQASQFLAAASALATVSGSSSARPMVVTGQPGSGKTAFVIHVAHRLRDRFPDAQLYVEALTAHGGPAEPADLAARLLRSLGTPAAAVPARFEERSALLRAQLSARRALVVLDDVVSEEQIRAVLPASGRCAVLVGARRRLATLDGAGAVELAPLPLTDALALFAAIAGEERVAADTDAAVDAVELCGRLPLAIRTFAARLAARPYRPLRPLVERLGDERDRLPLLASGTQSASGSITRSYDLLDTDAQRLLRLLTALPGAAFTGWVCAALLDAPAEAAEDALQQLVDAYLVEVIPTGPQYRVHDLPRSFAADLLRRRHPREGHDALRRVLGGWLTIAQDARRRAYGVGGYSRHAWVPRDRYGAPVPEPLGCAPPDWFADHRHTLLAALERARQERLSDVADDLAETLRPFLTCDRSVPQVAIAT